MVFDTCSRLRKGEKAQLAARLYWSGPARTNLSLLYVASTGNEGAAYHESETTDTLEMTHKFHLEAKWRNSSNNSFSSTNRAGVFSPIERIERPLTEYEMEKIERDYYAEHPEEYEQDFPEDYSRR
jgi:hypothetical protein